MGVMIYSMKNEESSYKHGNLSDFSNAGRGIDGQWWHVLEVNRLISIMSSSVARNYIEG